VERVCTFGVVVIGRNVERRAGGVILLFLKRMEWRMYCLTKMIDTYLTLAYIQQTLSTQLEHNTTRFNYLLECWKHELEIYSQELEGTKTHKDILQGLDKIDQERVNKLLFLYVERCK